MKRLPLLLAGCALAAAPPLAAQETPADTAAVHLVRPGDTLWDLARRYLEDPFLWTEIFQLNRDVVSDPNRIYPAERLRIPGLLVQPRGVARTREAPADARTVFFPEEARRDRLELGSAELRAVVRPGDFYRAGFLVADAEVRPVAWVAEVVSPSIVPLESQRAIHPNDRVFMTLSGEAAPTVGEQFQLVRRDRAVRGYGRIFVSTGLATVIAVEGEVATATIDQLHDDVRPGDLALPVAAFPVPAGVAPRAADGVEGRLVAFERAHAVNAIEDLAFLDVGTDAGVREGDEFVVYQPRSRAEWGDRPEIEIARVQVVRATRRTAAARVMGLSQPALQAGLPVRLTAKMP